MDKWGFGYGICNYCKTRRGNELLFGKTMGKKKCKTCCNKELAMEERYEKKHPKYEVTFTLREVIKDG